MKFKLSRILSLGLCFSLIAPTSAFAAPLQQDLSSNRTSAIESNTSGNILQNAEESEEPLFFHEYFPDPNFAQCVAEVFGRNSYDTVTLSELQSIESIDCFARFICSLEGIEVLTNLTEINLFYNLLSEIPAEIGNLTELTYLNIGQNQLSELPVEIGNLAKLKELYLQENILTEIPDTFTNLTELTHLYLNDNQLSQLPEDMGSLNLLTDLKLGDNNLRSLPQSMNNMTRLVSLTLEGNKLVEQLPDTIVNVENLNLEYQQPVILDEISIPRSQLTHELLKSPLILQIQERNEGVLMGMWTITNPDGTTEEIGSYDGSELNADYYNLFMEPGTYEVSYFYWYDLVLGGLTYYESTISVTITDTTMPEVEF